MANNEDLFKQIIAHAKEYGFIFPSSEIYDGLSAVYDYGQNGVELKNNIKQYWWKAMVQYHENIVGLDSAIFMHPTIWKASGHVDAFNDPLIDNKDSKKRYRADVLIEDHIQKIEDKIDKEIEKAKKRFNNFDEVLYRQTNTRVVQYQHQVDSIRARFAELMNNNDLVGLKALIEEWFRGRRCRHHLPPSRDGTGHLRELPQHLQDRPHEIAVRHRPDWKGLPQ